MNHIFSGIQTASKTLALPVKAYVAGKRLNTNDFASPDSDVRHFYSRPLQESLEAQSLGEERSHFFIALSLGNEKGSPPQAGSLLFIATGSVDMNIKFLPPALLGVSRPAEAGREIFFFFSRKYA